MTVSGCRSCGPAQPVAQQAAVPPVQRGYRRPPAEGNYAQAATRAANRGISADVRQVTQSSSRSAEITVTTAEGDKVTLSLAAQTGRTATVYRARGRGNDGEQQQLRAAENRTQGYTQVKVGIEGDLNEKEMADLKKLIEAFGQFTQGNASAMGQFGSLESLATAKLSYSGTNTAGYDSVRFYA